MTRQARVLITADGFYRRGRIVPMKETADAAVALSPTVERVLVVRRTGSDVAWTQGRDSGGTTCRMRQRRIANRWIPLLTTHTC